MLLLIDCEQLENYFSPAKRIIETKSSLTTGASIVVDPTGCCGASGWGGAGSVG
jgi:hypothetical protein